MAIVLALISFLAGLSIVALPLSTAFIPRLGLNPLKWGHLRPVRDIQITLVWLFAAASLWIRPSVWGLAAILLALPFSIAARRLFPRNIFVALERPRRSRAGLGENSPVLAVERNGETVAYPLELLVPHHVINDTLGGLPAAAVW
jgi:hypothetical protein